MAHEDLTAVIHELEFKLYETASNIGLLEDAKIKVNSRFGEMREQEKRLQANLDIIRKNIKDGNKHFEEESKNRKRHSLRHSQLLKQLEEIDNESNELRRQIANVQQVVDTYSGRDRIRDKKVNKVIDENNGLEQRIAELEMLLLHAAAATTSTLTAKDQELVKQRLKLEEEQDAIRANKDEIAGLELLLAEADAKYERVRRTDHSKEVELMHALANSAVQLQQHTQQLLLSESPQKSSDNNSSASSIIDSFREVRRQLGPPPQSPQSPSQSALDVSIQTPASFSSATTAAASKSGIERRLEELESVIAKQQQQQPQQRNDGAGNINNIHGTATSANSRPSHEMFEMIELRLKVSQLESLLQQRQLDSLNNQGNHVNSNNNNSSNSSSNAQMRMQTLQLQQNFEQLYTEMNSRLLLLESSLRKQFDARVSVYENEHKHQQRALTQQQIDMDALALQQAELSNEVRTLRQGHDVAHKQAHNLVALVENAESRLSSLESVAKTTTAQMSHVVDVQLRTCNDTLRQLQQVDLPQLQRSHAALTDKVDKATAETAEYQSERKKVKASLVALHNRLNRMHAHVEDIDASSAATVGQVKQWGKQTRQLAQAVTILGQHATVQEEAIIQLEDAVQYQQQQEQVTQALAQSPTPPSKSRSSKNNLSSPLHRINRLLSNTNNTSTNTNMLLNSNHDSVSSAMFQPIPVRGAPAAATNAAVTFGPATTTFDEIISADVPAAGATSTRINANVISQSTSANNNSSSNSNSADNNKQRTLSDDEVRALKFAATIKLGSVGVTTTPTKATTLAPSVALSSPGSSLHQQNNSTGKPTSATSQIPNSSNNNNSRERVVNSGDIRNSNLEAATAAESAGASIKPSPSSQMQSIPLQPSQLVAAAASSLSLSASTAPSTAPPQTPPQPATSPAASITITTTATKPALPTTPSQPPPTMIDISPSRSHGGRRTIHLMDNNYLLAVRQTALDNNNVIANLISTKVQQEQPVSAPGVTVTTTTEDSENTVVEETVAVGYGIQQEEEIEVDEPLQQHQISVDGARSQSVTENATFKPMSSSESMGSAMASSRLRKKTIIRQEQVEEEPQIVAQLPPQQHQSVVDIAQEKDEQRRLLQSAAVGDIEPLSYEENETGEEDRGGEVRREEDGDMETEGVGRTVSRFANEEQEVEGNIKGGGEGQEQEGHEDYDESKLFELIEQERQSLGLPELPIVFQGFDAKTAATTAPELVDMLVTLQQEKKALKTELNGWKKEFKRKHKREPEKVDRPMHINAKLTIYAELGKFLEEHPL